MDPQANPNVLPNPANLPNAPPGGQFEMPSMDEFIKLLENVKDMTDEEKEALKKEVLGRAQAGAAKMNRFTATFSDYAILVVMLAIIICIFVFFGYKLYKSLVEKEKKREEKQKAKQLKKKK